MIFHTEREVEDRPSAVARITCVGLLTACALLCAMVESRFPLPFPGVRLGLSNIFYLIALSLFGATEALCVVILRMVLVFLLSGNIFSLACTAGGLLFAMPIAIVLLRYFDHLFSVQAISVASSVAFNAGQLLAVVMMTGEQGILIYFPVLATAGCMTGYAIGTAAELVMRRIERFL